MVGSIRKTGFQIISQYEKEDTKLYSSYDQYETYYPQ